VTQLLDICVVNFLFGLTVKPDALEISRYFELYFELKSQGREIHINLPDYFIKP
jgi:hypothetical protein